MPCTDCAGGATRCRPGCGGALMAVLKNLLAKTRTAPPDSEGFILVAVLWMLLALATLVTVYAAFVTRSAFAVAANSDAIKTQPLIVAGVELAAYRLGAIPAKERPAIGQFSARVAAARLVVAYATEAARIDLNAAPKGLLSGLFVALGAAPAQADMFADVTVFGGQNQVDALAAAPEVLAALPGVTPQILRAVLAARDAGGLDQASLQRLVGGSAAALAAGTEAKNLPGGGAGDFENANHSAAEAVILLPDDGPAPYRVLSWQNAFDGAADRPRDFGGR